MDSMEKIFRRYGNIKKCASRIFFPLYSKNVTAFQETRSKIKPCALRRRRRLPGGSGAKTNERTYRWLIQQE